MQTLATVTCQSFAKSVAETSGIIIRRGISLALNSAQARIESHIVEQPAMQFDGKLTVFLIQCQEKSADELVDLGLHFQLQQGDTSILASAPGNVIEVTDALENRPEIAKLINEIQSDTAEVADEMRMSSSLIEEGREDIDMIAASLESIRNTVKDAQVRAEGIFRGADAHTVEVERMVRSMDEISEAGTRKAAAIDRVVETSRLQSVSTAEVIESSGSLTKLSAELAQVLSHFRTDSNPRVEGDR